MASGWQLILFEHEGEIVELHSLQSAVQAVEARRIGPDTPVTHYDDQGTAIRSPAGDLAQFQALFGVAVSVAAARGDASADVVDPAALKAARASLLRTLNLSLSGPGRQSLAGNILAGKILAGKILAGEIIADQAPGTSPATGNVDAKADVTPSPAARTAVPVTPSPERKATVSKPLGARTVPPAPKAAPRAAAGTAPVVPSAPPKKKGNGCLIVILGIVGFFILCIALSHCGHPSTATTPPSFAYDTFDTPKTYMLANGKKQVNVRATPGKKDDNVLAQVAAGDDVTVIGRARDDQGRPWLVVKMADGRIGCIKEDLLVEKLSTAVADAGTPSAPTGQTFETGFDCSGATAAVEQTICHDAGLAANDRTMTDVYKSLLLSATDANRGSLVASQRQWMRERNQCAAQADPAACLGPYYQARIATLQAWSNGTPLAEGNTQPPVAPTPEDAAAVPSTWIFPRPEVATNYYPERALNNEVEGTVTIDCTIGSDGDVTACDVLSERPAGYGFGQATVNLFEQYGRVRPSVAGVQLRDGEHKQVTYRWTLQ